MSEKKLEKQDENVFVLNEKDFERFEKMLDEPIPNAEKLRELLTTPSPWDKEEY